MEIDSELINSCLQKCFISVENFFRSANENEKIKYKIGSEEKMALFVSWKDGKKNLRGCIGTLNPIDLDEGIPHYAVTSAVHDSRFKPLNFKEFQNSECKVSLLYDFHIAERYDAWQPGLHGVIVEYKGSKATFLPEVAQEQKWNQNRTIREAVKKAGNLGSVDLEQCKVTTYLSTVGEMHYSDWSS